LLTDAITPAVERARKASGDLLDNAIASNVRLNVEALSTSDPPLAPAVKSGKLAVINDKRALLTLRCDFQRYVNL
jgi:hypothetical protein